MKGNKKIYKNLKPKKNLIILMKFGKFKANIW